MNRHRAEVCSHFLNKQVSPAKLPLFSILGASLARGHLLSYCAFGSECPVFDDSLNLAVLEAVERVHCII